MRAIEPNPDQINQRRCIPCGDYYSTKSSHEHEDPTACPRCGWRPGARRDEGSPAWESRE